MVDPGRGQSAAAKRELLINAAARVSLTGFVLSKMNRKQEVRVTALCDTEELTRPLDRGDQQSGCLRQGG